MAHDFCNWMCVQKDKGVECLVAYSEQVQSNQTFILYALYDIIESIYLLCSCWTFEVEYFSSQFTLLINFATILSICEKCSVDLLDHAFLDNLNPGSMDGKEKLKETKQADKLQMGNKSIMRPDQSVTK